MSGPNLSQNNETVRGILVSAMNNTLQLGSGMPVTLQSFTSLASSKISIPKVKISRLIIFHLHLSVCILCLWCFHDEFSFLVCLIWAILEALFPLELSA